MEGIHARDGGQTTDKRGTTTAEAPSSGRAVTRTSISGGHLVAKALKNEGVDTIFIHPVRRAHHRHLRWLNRWKASVSSTCATSRSRLTPRTVTRDRPQARLRGHHRRTRLHQCRDRDCTAFRSESPVAAHRRQGALTQHKMGSLQDPLPHVDLSDADHQVRRHGAEHRARRGHGLDGRRVKPSQRRPGAGIIWKFRAMSSIARWRSPKAIVPKPGHYRASTRSLWRSA